MQHWRGLSCTRPAITEVEGLGAGSGEGAGGKWRELIECRHRNHLPEAQKAWDTHGLSRHPGDQCAVLQPKVLCQTMRQKLNPNARPETFVEINT